MADLAPGKKSHGEVSVTQDGSGTDGRAGTKAKISTIWEDLGGKDSFPAVKPDKPSTPILIWMVNLGLAPPRGLVAHKFDQVQRDKLLKAENGTASNGVPKGRPVSINRDQVKAKESPRLSQIDFTVDEVLSRPREGADTSTRSNSKSSEGSKDFKAAQALRRKVKDASFTVIGLDDHLQQKSNILDRGRKDWGQFKLEKGSKDELED